MRKLGMGIVALTLFGGAAVAAENAPVQSAHRSLWVFSAGPTEAEVVDRTCPHDRLVSANRHRTNADWAAAVFTMGIYTPEHVVVKCGEPR
jgi:hypothetical protein